MEKKKELFLTEYEANELLDEFRGMDFLERLRSMVLMANFESGQDSCRLLL